MSVDMFGVRQVPVANIEPNPWQPRTAVNAERVQDLAADIRQNGLLQRPIARPHPQNVASVQLAFGHNRLAAWKLAFPMKPLPLEVRELSDRQMSDYAASENGQREDLTPIEKARAIARRMQDFSLNQLDAGAPFGYKTQGAVANLLRLLKLPEAIQEHVGDGGLPERHARMLVSVAKVLPKQTEQVAKLVIAAPEKDEVFAQSMRKLLREKGRSMWGAPFEKTMALPVKHVEKDALQVLGHTVSLITLPVCKGCEFFVAFDNAEYCMRSGCYDVKVQAFVWQEAERLGKKLGIAVWNGEKAEPVYVGRDHAEEKKALQALSTKHESLRLRPLWAANDHNDYDRERVLGSKYVALYTTDEAALRKALAKLPKEKKQAAVKSAMSEVQRDDKRRRENRDECRRLLLAAAPHVAKAFADFSEPVLNVMIPAMSNHHYAQTSFQIETRAKKADKAEKAKIVAEIVLSNGSDGGANSLYSTITPAVALRKIEALAQSLKVKLPAGWSVEKIGGKAGRF